MTDDCFAKPTQKTAFLTPKTPIRPEKQTQTNLLKPTAEGERTLTPRRASRNEARQSATGLRGHSPSIPNSPFAIPLHLSRDTLHVDERQLVHPAHPICLATTVAAPRLPRLYPRSIRTIRRFGRIPQRVELQSGDDICPRTQSERTPGDPSASTWKAEWLSPRPFLIEHRSVSRGQIEADQRCRPGVAFPIFASDGQLGVIHRGIRDAPSNRADCPDRMTNSNPTNGKCRWTGGLFCKVLPGHGRALTCPPQNRYTNHCLHLRGLLDPRAALEREGRCFQTGPLGSRPSH